jgi:hypothetical protein
MSRKWDGRHADTGWFFQTWQTWGPDMGTVLPDMADMGMVLLCNFLEVLFIVRQQTRGWFFCVTSLKFYSSLDRRTVPCPTLVLPFPA